MRSWAPGNLRRISQVTVPARIGSDQKTYAALSACVSVLTLRSSSLFRPLVAAQDSSGPQERQQVGVELILVGGGETMWRSWIHLQRRIGCNFHAELGRVGKRNDLVVIAVNDESGHVNLYEVFGEIGLGEDLDAVVSGF